MLCIYGALIGIALMQSDFFKINIAGIDIIYYYMAICLVISVRTLIANQSEQLSAPQRKYIIIYLIFSISYVVFSFFGYVNIFNLPEIWVNSEFLARQSYYLAFLFFSLFVFQNKNNIKCIEMLKKYGNILCLILLLVHSVLSHAIIGNVSLITISCFLSAISFKKRLLNILVCILILTIPLGDYGQYSQILIKLIYLSIIIFKSDKAKRLLSSLVLSIIIVSLVIPFLPLSTFQKIDANSIWRVEYWQDELKTLEKTYFLGVGYGTSYASADFVQMNGLSSGPFASSDQYSALEKVFVVGSHNSYMSIFYRTGIIGITLFLLFIHWILKNISSKKYNEGFFFLTLASLVILAFNTGLESPYYMFIFFVSMGNALCHCDNILLKNNKVIEANYLRLNEMVEVSD